jgi:spermidine synthase
MTEAAIPNSGERWAVSPVPQLFHRIDEHGALTEMSMPQPNFTTAAEASAAAAAEPEVSSLFCVETSDPFDSYTYRLESIHFSGRTGYQSVVIAKTYNYGMALFLDGQIQSAEDDEALYHELLVQPAMLRHESPKDVLILGGGEGATLREVLVHESVRSATMVDLDGELVDLCRQHLEIMHMGAFDDPRARLIIGDGRAFLEHDPNLYDVIIVDLVDMIEHTQISRLYTIEFYELVRQRLRPGGIVAVQGLEFSFLDDEAHAAIARTLRVVFKEVHSYRTHIPSFLASWGFMLASDWARPDEWLAEAIDGTIADRLGDWLDHVNGAFLKSCFAMCKDTLLCLAAPGPVLQDGVIFAPRVVIEVPEPTRAIFPYRQRV